MVTPPAPVTSVGVPAMKSPLPKMLLLSPDGRVLRMKRNLVTLSSSVSGTHAGGSVRKGVKSTLPATVSQPNVPGPPTHPHQLSSALSCPDVMAVPSAPSSLL